MVLNRVALRQSACLVHWAEHDEIMFVALAFFVEYQGSTSYFDGHRIGLADTSTKLLYFTKKFSAPAKTLARRLLSIWLANFNVNLSHFVSGSNYKIGRISM